MNPRKVMLMAGALIFALCCALFARNLVSGGPAAPANAALPAPVQTGPEVLVAIRTLTPGTIITPDALHYQPWPKDLVDKAYYLRGEQNIESLAGSVVRYPVTAGQPLTQGSLVKPGDRGFLAAALGPGMRAVTISVSAQGGVAGFIFPGDRVDLLLSQSVTGGGDGQPLKTTETIIQNLRVLATDQSTDKAVDETGKTKVATFGNVTVEVTPKIGEKIAVAESLGTLSLALRPIADDRMELERQIAAGEINVPEGTNANSKAEKQMLLQVAARPIESDTVTTGADVSKFQRSNVPGKSSAPVAAPAPTAPVLLRPKGNSISIARGQTVTEALVGGLN